MNLFLTIVLFLVIAAATGFFMAYLERKNLNQWKWVLFAFIVLLSLYSTSRNSLTEGIVLTFINAIVIYVFYEIFLKFKVARKNK